MALDTARQANPAPPSQPRGPAQRWPALAAAGLRAAVFSAYAVAVAAVAQRHEPWFDEAQAWLLARDESLWHLLVHQMRYEGSPPLWHLLLMGPAQLGAPYPTLEAIAVVIAILGAYVLVRFSPFPLPLTVGVLFSFVVAYQYAVVARSYVLLPPLLFCLALTWTRRLRDPWPFALVLTLLALTSTHGLLVAGSVFAVHMLQAWRPIDGVGLRPSARRAHLRGGLVFVVVCGLVVAQLWPAPDQSLGAGFNPDPRNLALVAPAVLSSALTGSPPLSLAAVALSALWFRRTRTLLLWTLPTLALLTLAAVKYHSYWHDGIPFLVWIFALWVSFAQGPVGAARNRDRWLRLGACLAMGGVLVVQSVWWWQTVRHDWVYPYSGSQQLAAWLERQPPSTEIAAIGFHALGALPYLDRNVYANLNGGRRPAAMHWSTTPRLVDDVWSVWLTRPDVIVWSVKSRRALTEPALPGYDRVAVFEGDLYWKNRAIERDAFYVFRLGQP
ncbi:MAG: hypothetical protein ACRD0K_24160 [Egibacteraceae bacterium]